MKPFVLPALLLALLVFFPKNPSAQTAGALPAIACDGERFHLTSEPPLAKNPKAGRNPFWRYFWEFGDGHFSYEKSPAHPYAQGGIHAVRLRLTPFYADEPSRVIEALIPACTTGAPPKSQVGEGSLFLRASSFSDRRSADAVPGQAFDLVLSYSAPFDMDRGGSLLFFSNKKDLPGPAPFEPVASVRSYQHFVLRKDPSAIFGGSVPEQARELQAAHSEVLAFETGKLRQGEQRRLFLTLAMSRELKKHRYENRKHAVAALWLPHGLQSGEDAATARFEFEVRPRREPSRLRVEPSAAFFKKRRRTPFTFRLRFQNEGDSVAEHVRVVIPTDAGLDPASLQVHGADFSGYQRCAEGDTLSPCYRTGAPSSRRGSFIVHFQHLGLESVKSETFLESSRRAKAGFEWSMSGSGRRQPLTRTKAKIYLQEGKPQAAPAAVIRWRMKSAYLRLGPPMGKIEGYAAAGTPFQAALGWQNAPLGAGFFQAAELGLSSMRFERETLGAVPPGDLAPGGGELFSKEVFRLKLLDLRVSAGWHLLPWLRLQGGAGLSAPAWGKVESEGRLTENSLDGGSATLAKDYKEVKFALWRDAAGDPKDGGHPLFQKKLSAPSRVPGYSLHVGAEVGLPNDISLGGAFEHRRLNRFHTGERLNISTFSVFVKFRLAAL